MSIMVQFSESLAERVGTNGAYVSVEKEDVTVTDVVESLAAEFGPERLPADAEAVRESAVGSEPLAPRARVTPGDRIRLRAGA
jgi:hypothetical protein